MENVESNLLVIYFEHDVSQPVYGPDIVEVDSSSSDDGYETTEDEPYKHPPHLDSNMIKAVVMRKLTYHSAGYDGVSATQEQKEMAARSDTASRHNSSGVGGSSNPSFQTPIQSSPNSQYSDFANPHGLDAIDLNDDIEDRRQDSIQHWHWKEDEMLISAWLNVSTDPVVGTDQKRKTFWSRIHSYCVEFCTDMTKGVVACKKLWYKINKAVAQFVGCYDQASRNIRSGSNADDIKELAYKLYSTNCGQKFTFERHWNMLRLEQKWRSQLPTQSGGSKRTKVSATGAYSSSSNPETPLADEPGVDSPVRPQGSKKSKRRGKGKAQMSENFSERKSSVVKKLSLMEDIKNVREKELMEREKEREEEKEHRAKMMAIKEKEIQIQAAMQEQELQTQRYIKEMEIKAKERKMDMQILNADMSTTSEKRRALHEIACEKIMAKWFT
ncbi:glutathione S-transferase T3-like [Arachis duranensis]|uniref:Glutathione S-transferase T3-like n=1 Tax=Arachis duranensis TaxID=130453 RepID=A0A6P4DN79_ARADU|nr:glutathione S-transferase T3-like [Arachis duranensis]